MLTILNFTLPRYSTNRCLGSWSCMYACLFNIFAGLCNDGPKPFTALEKQRPRWIELSYSELQRQIGKCPAMKNMNRSHWVCHWYTNHTKLNIYRQRIISCHLSPEMAREPTQLFVQKTCRITCFTNWVHCFEFKPGKIKLKSTLISFLEFSVLTEKPLWKRIYQTARPLLGLQLRANMTSDARTAWYGAAFNIWFSSHPFSATDIPVHSPLSPLRYKECIFH